MDGGAPPSGWKATDAQALWLSVYGIRARKRARLTAVASWRWYLRLGARDAAGDDLAGLGEVLAQGVEILVIDLLDALGGELAELAAAEELGHVLCSSRRLRRLRRSSASMTAVPTAFSFSSRRRRSPRSGLSPFSSLFFMISDCSVSASSRRITRWRRTASLKRKLSTSSLSTAWSALDVEQDVVRLDQVVDRIASLATAPIFQAVDLAAAILDQALVALDHGRHLLALVRMDQEHDFVMTHGGSLWMWPRCTATGQPPAALDAGGGARFPAAKAAGSRKLWQVQWLTGKFAGQVRRLRPPFWRRSRRRYAAPARPAAPSRSRAPRRRIHAGRTSAPAPSWPCRAARRSSSARSCRPAPGPGVPM